LLATKLPDAIRERNMGTAAPAVLVGAAVLTGAFFVATDFQYRPVLASSLIAARGGASYFLLPETHRRKGAARSAPSSSQPSSATSWRRSGPSRAGWSGCRSC
jgi:hypothetical protein